MIRFAAILVAVLQLLAAPAQAEDYQKFTPLLVDLPGWEAEPADGMSMDLSGQKMASATRNYQKGEAQADAAIMWGAGAAGQMPAGAGHQAMRIETGDGYFVTEAQDDFTVTRQYSRTEKSGAVMVGMGDSLMFVLNYTGLSDGEGEALARRFDWKAIKAVAK